jgi:glycosyltransferase involved in cell wall biosynthesis
MRVLNIYSGNLYGGVETMMTTLARYRHQCPRLEWHFALCFDGRLSAELRQHGVPVTLLGEVSARNPRSIWRARNALRRLLENEPFDIVICHAAWAHALFASVARATAATLGFWFYDPPQKRLKWHERWARRMPPDFTLSISQHTAAGLARLYPQSPNELIYCPVAAAEESIAEDERMTIRTRFAASGQSVVIVQIGRLEPHKGHLLHLEALGQLRDLPNWVCWQIGGAQRPFEKKYLETLKRRAVELGIESRVMFLGWQSEVRRLLAAADIYCQPNISPEPFGLSYIEAMYARLPVVAAAEGGPLEIIDKSCGLLVPPRDASALADSLKRLIESPALRTALGKSGPSRARHLCDPAKQIQHLCDALHRFHCAVQRDEPEVIKHPPTVRRQAVGD